MRLYSANPGSPPDALVEQARILEVVPREDRPYVDRPEAAELVDRLLVRVAHGQGAIDLAIGDRLAALAIGDRTLQLGYSSIGDYARERLGMAPRTAQAAARLARELRARPMLRSAVCRGDVSARKAKAILPLAIGEAEAEWVARARSATVRALEAAARSAGAGAGAGEEPWERLAAELTPEQREIVDGALELAGEVIGAGAPIWQRLEAMCEEYLGGNPVEPGGETASAAEAVVVALQDLKACHEVEMDSWRWLDELHRETERREAATAAPRGRGGATPTAASTGSTNPSDDVGDLSCDPPLDSLALDDDLRRLARMRDSWDELLGHLALHVQSLGLWRDMGFASFGHYCAERLGMADRTVAQRVALERRLYAVPGLREALGSGRLSYEKARLVASAADDITAADWIARAERTTAIALRREIDATEEAQMRARGALDVRVPRSVGILLADAFRSVRETEGRWLTPGECLVRVAATFILVWKDALGSHRSRAARVVARDRGRCQVPGCSRSAAHAHHVVFRSAGGDDAEANLVSLCAGHHLHGVHAGWIHVSGRAPDALRWELGLRHDGWPLEIFEAQAALAS